MNAKSCGPLLLLLAIPTAFAEGGCPPGYYPHNVPGVMGCAPIPGYYQAPQQVWVDAYGTLVWWKSEDGTPRYSFSARYQSKQDAEERAMNECKISKGIGCGVAITIKNGFIAVANNSLGGLSAGTGNSEKSAIDQLNKNCNYSHEECEITKVIDTQGWYENASK